MDPAGGLYIRTELEDAEDVKIHDAVFAKPDERNQQGGYGGYGDGGYGRGGEGGYQSGGYR
jgi:hypothetical protein